MRHTPVPSRRLPPATRCFAGLGLLLGILTAPPAWSHERTDLTLAALSRSIAADPSDVLLRLRRAELHRIAGDFAAAEADLDALESMAPGAAGLTLSRATLALDRGDAASTLALLDAAPDREVERGERFRLRALAFTALGRADDAIRAWDAALATLERVAPEHYLARARLQVSADRVHDARAGLAEGVARLGGAASLSHALAMLDADGAVAPEPATPGPSRSAAPPPASLSRPGLDAITIARGPWLQSTTTSSIVVRWRTSTATNSRVWYGPAPGSYTGFVDVATSLTEHEVPLTGLTAGTLYYYTVGSTTEIAAGGDSLFFRTHPLPGAEAPTRIWVIGDSGLPGAGQDAVRDAFLAWRGARDPDVWLMLGDNAYNSGTDSEYQSGLFAPYRALLRRWPLWPTRGNHDFVRSGANNDYYEFFTLPTAGQSGGLASGTEAYYSFDFGPIHFACLDSEGSDRSRDGAMLMWLAADLAANTRPWTIAYFHHPPYTKGSHDSDNAFDSGGRMRDMRENALPILEAAGVDLVLTGHSHSYERSFLLDGHYGTSGTLMSRMKSDGRDGRPDGDGPYVKPTFGKGPHEGAVYVVDGSSAQISGGRLDHPVMMSSLNVLGSLVIDVEDKRLDARFLSSTGIVRDSFAIVKSGAGSVPVADVGERGAGGLRLGPALPNPFRSELTLSFQLENAGDVRVEVFDAAGRSVATLVRGPYPAGAHLARWNGLADDGRVLPAGVYLASLEVDGRRVTRRIALVR